MGVHEQNEFEIDRLFLGSNGEFTDSFVSGWTRRPRAPCGCPRGNRRRNFPVRFHAGRCDVSGWIESSDTVREPGKSKAALVLQKARLFQRAVFFALLNPQPNGAGFAGVYHQTDLDLSPFSSIDMKLRGQGANKNFKIILRHGRVVDRDSVSYELFFDAPASDELRVVRFPLTEFKPYWRGKPQNDSEPLDASNISSIGIQFYGGVYEEAKQSGPATLEIDWIKASK